MSVCTATICIDLCAHMISRHTPISAYLRSYTLAVNIYMYVYVHSTLLLCQYICRSVFILFVCAFVAAFLFCFFLFFLWRVGDGTGVSELVYTAVWYLL